MQKTLRLPRHRLLMSLLIKARKNVGLSQAALAKCLSKSQSFVAKYETGERRIDIVEFLDICEVLDVNPLKIITEVQNYEF